MLKSRFYYDLPKNQIAQSPLADRKASRMLFLNGTSGNIRDLKFPDLFGLVNEGDLLVFNNTKVFPARLFGRKETGGKIEILVERLLGERKALVQVKANKSPKVGQTIYVEGGCPVLIAERRGRFFVAQFQTDNSIMEIFEKHGHIPLPPYITRSDEPNDRDRYQTVYARNVGAVAAPTAGLHFDLDFIDKLLVKGIKVSFLTLHVGSGTFSPLKSELIDDHIMHPEVCEIPERVVDDIYSARENGGRIIAVGTTVVRALESAADGGQIKPFKGETELFIKPGYKFACVDAMITNFHLPESTLLVLVCAFAGFDHVMEAYKHAVQRHYRFFSYGDAMFVTKGI